MKPILAILVLTVAVSLDVGAQDVRSKVGPPSRTSITNIIDPDKSVYGAQWGSGEDEFINTFGYPTGYIRLNGAETAMIYGRSHAFIFTASKLSGVRIYNSSVLDWKLSQALLTLTPFDGMKWQLSNGIRREMNLADVKKILGNSLRDDHPGRYQIYFNSDKARIEIDFSHVTNEGEKDEAYKVFGIYIRQASLPSSALRKTPVLVKPLQAPTPEATQPTAHAEAAGDSDTNPRAFVEKARASMVVITGEDKAGQPIALGAGFVIGNNLIATDTSVVNSALPVHVRVAGQESQTMKIVSRDSYRHATILTVMRTQTAASQAPPLPLGDSDNVAVRDKVYFAADADRQDSMLSGIIREISAMNGKRYFFEISAGITSSSKGGPLFNSEGEVIGILGDNLKGKNPGRVIPASDLKTLLEYRSVGTSAGDSGAGVGTQAGSGNPGADGPVSAGPGQGSSAGGSNAQPEGSSPAATSADTKPVLLNYVSPLYTEEARANKTQGVVNMFILVGEDGQVKQTRITKGLPDRLNEQAVTAAYQMKFRPATRSGQAVSYWLRIAVEFNLR